MCFHSTDPNLFYAAHGATIARFDRRNVATALGSISHNSDDITQLDMHASGNFLAAADDSGAVQIVDLRTETRLKTLNGHENICSTFRFRPEAPSKGVSGGLDSTIVSWDAVKGKRLAKVSAPDLPAPAETSESVPCPPAINPPYAFDIAFTPDGTSFAAALGSGAIHVLDCQSEGKLRHRSAIGAHMGSVASVAYLREASPMLVSGGVDGHLRLWSLSSTPSLASSVAMGAKVNAVCVSSYSPRTVFVGSVRRGVDEVVVRG